MQRDIEKVEELYAAFQKHDLRSTLQVLDKNIELVFSAELPWGGVYRGHDGARQAMNAVAEHLDARIVIERLIDAGDKIVAVGRTVGKTRSTRLEFDVPVVHVWTFEDGLANRFEGYLDNPTMRAVLGV